MKVLLRTTIVILLLSSHYFSQEPVSVLRSRWFRTVRQAPETKLPSISSAKPVNPNEKHFQRKAREQRTDNPRDPYDDSIEGRSAALDRAVQQSRTPHADDAEGYSYEVEVRNDTGQTVRVIFWEYRFVEIARPENEVRRQFLCGVKLNNSEKKELSAFTLRAPSDVLYVASLAKPPNKLFHEKVLVNRIELSDGNILQRNDWKYEDVKAAVEAVTSTPWGTDVCRAL
ncbi:MAG: hypothetical protein ABIV48_03825 [Pyrinomonadaceae bacterium]